MRQLQRRRPLRPPDWPCAHRPSHTVPLSSSARRGTESSLSEGEDRRDGERQTTCRPAATQGPSKVHNERTQPKCLHALCCGANNKAAQSNQRCMESPCHDATLDNSSNRRTCCCCSGCQHTAREIKTSATGSGALRAQHAMRQGSLLPGRDEVISVWLVAINNHVGPLS